MVDVSLIDIKKGFTQSSKKYRPDKCIICGKVNPKFCNSHSVPRFVLKNITDNGMITQSISLISDNAVNLVADKKGIRNTGTFHNICVECDGKVFSDYEDPIAIKLKPNMKLLLEIAIKNTLFSIEKKYLEKGVNEYTRETFGACQPLEEYYKYDWNDMWSRLLRLKKALINKRKIEFELLFWAKLDYVVPIACQEEIVLIADLEGYVINDVFDKDLRHKMQCLNLCIYPLDDCSVVMLFVDKSYTKYKPFSKQFNEKDFDTKLSIINYIVLSLTEDYYIYPNVKNDIFKNKSVKQICSDLHLVHSDFAGNIDPKDSSHLLCLLKNRMKIPNLLSEKYAIK